MTDLAFSCVGKYGGGGGGGELLGRRGEYGDAAPLRGKHGEHITGPGAQRRGDLLGQLDSFSREDR